MYICTYISLYVIYIKNETFISKVWKKPIYYSFRYKCLIFDICTFF